MKLTSVYFSATFTTRRVVDYVSRRLSEQVTEYDITNDASTDKIFLVTDELLVVGIPVYAGRVPVMAVDRIRRFKGRGSRAVAIVVYGNRHYDDALLELSDILSENGFQVISASAFLAQHSIFPKVGANRPDKEDFLQMDAFVDETRKILQKENGELLPIHIPGNRPYKIPGSIPIFPSGTKTCKECGKCASLCPVGAIPVEHPKLVDESKCFKCGRCVVVCPTHSRRFKGLKYFLASLKFGKMCSERREPEMFFCEVLTISFVEVGIIKRCALRFRTPFY